MNPITWLGSPALSWIVDMSSIGVTVGYLFTCIAAFKHLSWKRKGNLIFSPVKKAVSLAGIIISASFILLLILPFSPAFLQVLSIIALFMWGIVGGIFYMKIYKKYSKISESDLRYYMLNQSSVSVK